MALGETRVVGSPGDPVADFVAGAGAGAGAGAASSVGTVAASVESPTPATQAHSASRGEAVPEPSGSPGGSAEGRIHGWESRIADNTAVGPGGTGLPEPIQRRAFGRSALRWCLQTGIGSCPSLADVSDVDVWSR